ncbi:LysR family transcriptional regulator [Caballeronia sp. 15715]|uniref:LysR family transcriptional regulator n=1 Tax=Caballeronia sp. 15715 TaxID=3391030 RepID=UPI0039E371EE
MLKPKYTLTTTVVTPPRPKNLPLNAIRAFEASARLGSFVAAAHELGVTQGAVAAHIKTLEAQIGVRLFERQPRGIEMTALARRVLPGFIGAFDAMGAATQALLQEAAPQQVHVATLPAIAQLWLSPRLPELRKIAPDISVSISALGEPPNLKRVPFDLSIFYRPHGEGVTVEREMIFPVCTPAIAKSLTHPADLVNATCLIDPAWADDWAIWAKAAAPGVDFVPEGPMFSLYALAVAEAVNGGGVLMGHRALVRSELESGRLVAPFQTEAELPTSLSIAWARKPRRHSAAELVVELLTAPAR